VVLVDPEHAWSLEAVVAETRAAVAHLEGDLSSFRIEVRQDIRRLDDRIFQMLLIQLATLATALGSLVAALLTATR
jgi:hypothetical protein